MNPFVLRYKKGEDRVTNLFTHALTKCNIANSFFNQVYNFDTFERSEFHLGLQLHNEFTYPVKEAFLLSISNSGIVKDANPNEKIEGNPDAYFYDQQNQILILIEVKVGDGTVFKDQLGRHKSKVKTVPSDSWIIQNITWNWIYEFLKTKLNDENNTTELTSYILNNFIGVIGDEIIGSNYNEDYFLWLSDNYRNLIKNISDFLSKQCNNYEIKLPNGNHTEVRYYIGKTRFATFVLNQSRFILHPGGTTGLKWRRHVQENYGVLYDQGDSYKDEFSIPFSFIDDETLTIIPLRPNYILDEFFDIKNIIEMTLKTNPKIKKHIQNGQI